MLTQHRADMLLDGLDGDVQPGRDLLVRESLAQQLEHLPLPCRQRVAERHVAELAQDAAEDQHVALGRCHDGAPEFGGVGVARHDAPHAGHDPLAHRVGRLIEIHDQGEIRVGAVQRRDQVDVGLARHPRPQQHHIGGQQGDGLDGGRSLPDLRDHLHARLPVAEQADQPRPHRGLVVDDHHALTWGAEQRVR